jgi:hypothetical protein
VATLLDPDATVSSVVREAGIHPSCRGQSRARPSLSFAPARIVPDAEHGRRRGRPSGADGIIVALRAGGADDPDLLWGARVDRDGPQTCAAGSCKFISFAVIFWVFF